MGEKVFPGSKTISYHSNRGQKGIVRFSSTLRGIKEVFCLRLTRLGEPAPGNSLGIRARTKERILSACSCLFKGLLKPPRVKHSGSVES